MKIQSLIGLFALASLAWVISENRRKVSVKGALAGIAVQLLIAGVVPERRSEVVSLGMKSIVSGTLATCMTGAVVGFFT